MSRPIFVRPIALIVVFATASIASAPVALGQTPSIVDSVLALNRTGQWELAGQLAGKSLAAAKSPDEKCALLFNGLYAATRLGRFVSGPRSLKTFDDECATTATAKQYAAAIADLRRELELPEMPTTGVDWTAVDQFWLMVDTLTRGIHPSAGAMANAPVDSRLPHRRDLGAEHSTADRRQLQPGAPGRAR